MMLLESFHRLVAFFPIMAKFAVLMALFVIMPRLSRCVRVPEAVGLLLSGVVIGPHMLDVFPRQHPVADFFSELGMLLLMFFAGLEINLPLFLEKISRSIVFGVLTTLFPLLLGTLAAHWLGYGLLPAIVMGSLLSSHTLLGLPVVRKLRAIDREPVVVTVGATMVGLGRGGAYLLKRVENDEETQFLVMLGALAVTALLAQAINLPGIVGTFLAGLVVNAAVKDKPAKRKLEFMGNTLFVPAFFIVTGFLIDPIALARNLTEDFLPAAGIIGALLVGKWIAAESCGRAFGYKTSARRMMWSLTLPQVAATLAAYRTFNAAGQPLLDRRMLGGVFIVVLFTSILGPMLTEHFALRMLELDRPATGNLPA